MTIAYTNEDIEQFRKDIRNITIEECARVADERAARDRGLYQTEIDWQMPYAFNRVARASMDIAAAIRALKD